MTGSTGLPEQLCRLIATGDVPAVEAMLRDRRVQVPAFDINQACDPNAQVPVSPLALALASNDPRMVALLMRQPGLELTRSLPRYDTWHWVQTVSVEVLQAVFADPGADPGWPDANGKTALHEAAEDPSGLAKLDYLLERGVEPDPRQGDGTTPLYLAALHGNVPAVDALLRHPVDPNNRNTDNRWTVLMVAVAGDHPAIVEELLRQPGLDVNARSDVQETALHLAAHRGSTRCVAALLDSPGVEVNARDRNGWTPLIKAAFANQVEVVRQLCARADVRVNAVDQDRQTALHWAVLAGNPEVVRILLQRTDLNISLTNRPERQTALDLAIALHDELSTRLLEPMAAAAKPWDELSPGDGYVPRRADEPLRDLQRPAIGDPPKKRP